MKHWLLAWSRYKCCAAEHVPFKVMSSSVRISASDKHQPAVNTGAVDQRVSCRIGRLELFWLAVKSHLVCLSRPHHSRGRRCDFRVDSFGEELSLILHRLENVNSADLVNHLNSFVLE